MSGHIQLLMQYLHLRNTQVNDKGEEIKGAGEGILCMRKPWPAIMRTVYGDHERFEKTYFSTFKVSCPMLECAHLRAAL